GRTARRAGSAARAAPHGATAPGARGIERRLVSEPLSRRASQRPRVLRARPPDFAPAFDAPLPVAPSRGPPFAAEPLPRPFAAVAALAPVAVANDAALFGVSFASAAAIGDAAAPAAFADAAARAFSQSWRKVTMPLSVSGWWTICWRILNGS